MKCHVRTLGRTVCAIGLCAFLSQPSFSKSEESNAKSQIAQAQNAPISFDELDETETNKADERPSEEEAEPEKPAPEKAEADGKKPTRRRAQRTPLLPTVDELVEAKLSALRKKQEEQEQALAVAEQKLAQEVAVEKRTFDNSAYFSLTMRNEAPKADYELRKSEVYVDGRRIARGGKRNDGLPRNADSIFFGAVEPGCHDIEVRAQYVRLKNDLISRFKVDRVENVSKQMAFVAKNGYRVEIDAEGFEAHNSIVNWKRGPEVRLNRSVRPNFLPGAPIVSMDEVLKQGRVLVEYVTEDSSAHRLIEKSLSIDGLPILVNEKHDPVKGNSIVFDAPLADGKHTLNAVLLFGENKWVKGGPQYNFRLTFNRDFYVIRGQSTFINLTGMPHNGLRRSAEDTRYARVVSEIRSERNRDMFFDMTCKELREKQAGTQKKAEEEAVKKVGQPSVPAPEKPVPPPEGPAGVEPPKEEAKPAEPAQVVPAEGIPVQGEAQPDEPILPLPPKMENPNPGLPPMGPVIEQDTRPSTMAPLDAAGEPEALNEGAQPDTSLKAVTSEASSQAGG